MSHNKNKHGSKKHKHIPTQSEIYKEQGTMQLNHGNYPEAIVSYSKAMESDKDNFAHYHNRSLAYFLAEDYTASLKDILICKSLNPQYIQVYVRQASALIELGELAEAQACLVEGQKLEKDNKDLIAVEKKIEQEQKERTTETEKASNEQIQKMEKLKEWVLSFGADLSQVRVKYDVNNERSLIVKKRLEKDDLILSIPRNAMITLENANKDTTIQAAKEQKLEFKNHKHTSVALSILKAQLQGNDSPLLPYIATLPTDFSNFPANYTEQELTLLQGTAFSQKLQEQQTDIQEDYSILCKVDNTLKDKISFEQFKQASLCSRSRLFASSIDEVKTSALVPFSDMINHKTFNTQNADWSFDQQSQTFQVKAISRIERNSEVFFTYGPKCNSKLLLNYGFVDVAKKDDSPVQMPPKAGDLKPREPPKQIITNQHQGISRFNEVPVLFGFDDQKDDPTLPLKALLMGGSSIPKACLGKITEDYEHADSAGFLGYMRFIAIRDPAVLSRLSESHKKYKQSTNQPDLPFLPQKTPPVSVENEIAMWSKVQDNLIPILLKHTCSSKKDEEELEEESQGKVQLSRNQKACLLIRLGEKKVLEFYIDMASKMTHILQKKTHDKKYILESARTNPVYLPFFHYIIQVILARLLYQK